MENNILDQDLQTLVDESSKKIDLLVEEIHKVVVWQDNLIKSLIIWLLAKWHILLEWVPWLAKTLTVDTLSKSLDLWFNRIQFTPDLLPSDLVWTEIYNTKTWEFLVKLWPVFNNFILADEINRAPSKVQSALLEAMAEKQITIWEKTYKIPEPFIVLATQNPIEQAWTYRLPEAQLDRFLMKVLVTYPQKQDEVEMYKKINSNIIETINKIFTKDEIFSLQNLVGKIYVSDKIFNYSYDLIDATRNPENYGLDEIKNYIEYWISPRWWLSLISCAKVVALFNSRTFVIPEDIKFVANSVLSHRLVLTYEAVANDITQDDIIDMIIKKVNVI